MPDELPVLIAGAGPTGLMLAGELARYGVACRLIDKAPGPGKYSRAIAVQSRTTEIFSYLGMADELVARGVKIHGMTAHFGGDRLAHVTMDELDSPFPFVVGVPQTDTEDILTKRLATFGIAPEWGTSLGAFTNGIDGVTATLQKPDGTTEAVAARYLVGCDGAHSAVRKGAGLTFLGETYETGFALADVHVSWDHRHDEVHLFPSEHGLFAAFPLPGQDRYRLFWESAAAVKIEAGQSAQHGQVTDKPPPSLADVKRVLAERVPDKATAHDPLWTADFRVNSRMAAGYRNGRCFLAGDAAHIHSPAGGQGMNTGLQDAFNLAWKMALVEAGTAKTGLLDTYHAERHAVGVNLLKMTDRMIHMAMLRQPVVTAVRNALMPTLMGLEVVQQRVRRMVSELAVGYRGSPLSAEHHGGPLGGLMAWREFANGPHAGDRAPDAPVVTPTGLAGHLFDLLRDPKRFTLLLFAGRDATPEAVALQTKLAAWVNADRGDVVRAAVVAPSAAAGAFGDLDHVAHDKYGARAACLYLLRPDGYVAFRSQPVDAEKLDEYLRTWLTK